nr:D-arabinono-1,4-lactone oxidase [Paracoccus salsus]
MIHNPPNDGADYYAYPTTKADLQSVLSRAVKTGVPVRVSGQRHSQPPLVAADNRSAWPNTKLTTFLIDMSCYRDIYPDGIMLGPGPNQVTVNPGVREDNVDTFLTANNLMFKTATAGGFFSIGGMTAVDVHGATVAQPIFAETASAFTIMGPDGTETTIDADSPAENGWHPLQFVRVSLGGLGIVTRITLDVAPRPCATSLKGATRRFLAADKSSFVAALKPMLSGPTKSDRMEVFYTPYAAKVGINNFLALTWDEVANPTPRTPNQPVGSASPCALADKGDFGAPFMTGLAEWGVQYVRASQLYNDPYNVFEFPPVPTSGFVAIGLDDIEKQAKAANAKFSDLWLAEASQVMFMSYFVELPDLADVGLGMVWDGLNAAGSIVAQNGPFHLAAPMEFRFIRGGDSAMSGTYTTTPGATFVNLDLIGFIEAVPSASYPAPLLKYFADVERIWVAMGGFPHNGKMYGFYDPAGAAGSFTGAFNPAFIADLAKRRGERLQAYAAYRKSVDPNGVFLNPYLASLIGA